MWSWVRACSNYIPCLYLTAVVLNYTMLITTWELSPALEEQTEPVEDPPHTHTQRIYSVLLHVRGWEIQQRFPARKRSRKQNSCPIQEVQLSLMWDWRSRKSLESCWKAKEVTAAVIDVAAQSKGRWVHATIFVDFFSIWVVLSKLPLILRQSMFLCP